MWNKWKWVVEDVFWVKLILIVHWGEIIIISNIISQPDLIVYIKNSFWERMPSVESVENAFHKYFISKTFPPVERAAIKRKQFIQLESQYLSIFILINKLYSCPFTLNFLFYYNHVISMANKWIDFFPSCSTFHCLDILFPLGVSWVLT